jgi:hypothetical protein
MESLKKSFNICSKEPFLFMWGSLLFIFMLLLFAFAALGFFLIYFLFLSAFGQEVNLESIATIGVVGLIGLLMIFFGNGINAGIAMAYHEATKGKKVSLTKFYSYAIDRAPTMFGIMLVRELIWLLLVGPFIAIYFYFLEPYEYMDIVLICYALFMTFVIHMLFTPAFVLTGSFGTGMFSSMKQSLDFFKKKHVFFVGLYILFAVVWLMNFLPFLQIASIFFLYPLVYTAMIIMIKDAIKISTEGDEY